MNSRDTSEAFKPPHPALALGYMGKRKFKTPRQRIENAMHIIATIIANDGDIYLPIFQRLEKELDAHQEKEKSLKRALEISKGDPV